MSLSLMRVGGKLHWFLDFKDDLRRSLSLRDWFESLPSDSSKPFHDFLDS